MKNRRLLFIGVGVVALLVIGGILQSTLRYGNIKVSGTDKFTEILLIDSERNEKPIDGTIRVSPGTYTVLATAPLSHPFTKQVTVGGVGSEEVALEYKERGANDIIALFSKDYLVPVEVVKSAFFEDNTWVVIDVAEAGGGLEGSTNTYQFKNGDWVVRTGGTGLDVDDYIDEGFPDTVIQYLVRSNP